MLTIRRVARPPRNYAYWNEQIYIDCVPDVGSQLQILELNGYVQPNVLVAATATLLPDEWDEVIIAGAEWRVWVGLNEHDRAYEAKQNFGQLVNEIADFRRLQELRPASQRDCRLPQTPYLGGVGVADRG
jgi:hypothetical protein